MPSSKHVTDSENSIKALCVADWQWHSVFAPAHAHVHVHVVVVCIVLYHTRKERLRPHHARHTSQVPQPHATESREGPRPSQHTSNRGTGCAHAHHIRLRRAESPSRGIARAEGASCSERYGSWLPRGTSHVCPCPPPATLLRALPRRQDPIRAVAGPRARAFVG